MARSNTLVKWRETGGVFKGRQLRVLVEGEYADLTLEKKTADGWAEVGFSEISSDEYTQIIRKALFGLAKKAKAFDRLEKQRGEYSKACSEAMGHP